LAPPKKKLDENKIPDKGEVSEKWRRYLIDNFNHYFKDQISEKNIVKEYWGIRVLIRQSNRSVNATSRRERIQKDGPNFYSIYGGKLTGHLALAQKIFKLLYSNEKSPEIPKLNEDQNQSNDINYFIEKEYARTTEDVLRRMGIINPNPELLDKIKQKIV